MKEMFEGTTGKKLFKKIIACFLSIAIVLTFSVRVPAIESKAEGENDTAEFTTQEAISEEITTAEVEETSEETTEEKVEKANKLEEEITEEVGNDRVDGIDVNFDLTFLAGMAGIIIDTSDNRTCNGVDEIEPVVLYCEEDYYFNDTYLNNLQYFINGTTYSGYNSFTANTGLSIQISGRQLTVSGVLKENVDIALPGATEKADINIGNFEITSDSVYGFAYGTTGTFTAKAVPVEEGKSIDFTGAEVSADITNPIFAEINDVSIAADGTITGTFEILAAGFFKIEVVLEEGATYKAANNLSEDIDSVALDLSDSTDVEITMDGEVYNGNDKIQILNQYGWDPQIEVSYNGVTLEWDSDYIISYEADYSYVGDHTLTIEFQGNYSGEKTVEYNIYNGEFDIVVNMGKGMFHSDEATGALIQHNTNGEMVQIRVGIDEDIPDDMLVDFENLITADIDGTMYTGKEAIYQACGILVEYRHQSETYRYIDFNYTAIANVTFYLPDAVAQEEIELEVTNIKDTYYYEDADYLFNILPIVKSGNAMDISEDLITFTSSDTDVITVSKYEALADGTIRVWIHPKNPGTSIITVELPDSVYYTGDTYTKEVSVDMRDISDAVTVTPAQTVYEYDGEEFLPDITVHYNEVISGAGEAAQRIVDKDLELDTEYSIAYPEDMTSAGEKTITIYFLGNYSGSAETTVEIAAADISDLAEVTLDKTVYAYDGNEWEPTVSVKLGDKTLVKGTDYTIAYPDDMTSVGEKEITVNFKGNYKGSATASGEIVLVAYAFNVTPGVGYSLTSGSESQEEIEGAMETVVYTLDDGYYFPENFAEDISATIAEKSMDNPIEIGSEATYNNLDDIYDVSGLKIEINESKITLSGTLKADIMSLELPDAAEIEQTKLTIEGYENEYIYGEESFDIIIIPSSVSADSEIDFTDANITVKSSDVNVASVTKKSVAADGTLTATVTIKKMGVFNIIATLADGATYTGANKESGDIEVKARDISDEVDVTLKAKTHVYDGKAWSPELVVVWNETTLVENDDYQIFMPEDMTSEGEKELEVKFFKNFTGSKKVVGEIIVKRYDIAIEAGEGLKLTKGNTTQTNVTGEIETVEYSLKEGYYLASNYLDMITASKTVSDEAKTYTGANAIKKACGIAITLVDDKVVLEGELTSNINITLPAAYENNSTKLSIEGIDKDSYTYGKKDFDIKIIPEFVNEAKDEKENFKGATFSVASSDNNVATVEIINTQNDGTAVVRVSIKKIGKFKISAKLEDGAVYTGSTANTEYIDVFARDISDTAELHFVDSDTYQYDGNEWKPEISVLYNGKTLTSDDYSIAYPEDMISIGKKEIVVAFKGNYTGSKSITGEIVEAPTEPEFVLPENPFVISGTKGENDYYISNVTLTAKDGYGVAFVKGGQYTNSVIYTESIDAGYIYMIDNKTGAKSDAIAVPGFKIDIAAPTVIGATNGNTIYADTINFTVLDDNLAKVTINDEEIEIVNNKIVVDLSSNLAKEDYNVVAKDEAGNTVELSFTVSAEWMKNSIIPENTNIRLLPQIAYKLAAGKWKMSGDSTTYSGGITFYIRQEGECTFSHK